jgi:hypothetical protein
MKRGNHSRVVLISAVLIAAWTVSALAGGPICPPRGCGPAYCPQPMCMPPACLPPMCSPPMCAPPVCPPRTCGPPPCKPNPLAQICEGAFRLVAGVIALPFKVVGCMVDFGRCKPRCGYPPAACCPPVACASPISVPPYILGPSPMAGYGMGPGVPPIGLGRRPPRKFSPMAKKKGPLEMSLMAEANEAFFGAYW